MILTRVIGCHQLVSWTYFTFSKASRIPDWWLIWGLAIVAHRSLLVKLHTILGAVASLIGCLSLVVLLRFVLDRVHLVIVCQIWSQTLTHWLLLELLLLLKLRWLSSKLLRLSLLLLLTRVVVVLCSGRLVVLLRLVAWIGVLTRVHRCRLVIKGLLNICTLIAKWLLFLLRAHIPILGLTSHRIIHVGTWAESSFLRLIRKLTIAIWCVLHWATWITAGVNSRWAENRHIAPAKLVLWIWSSLIWPSTIRVCSVNKFLSCTLERVAGAGDTIFAIVSELSCPFNLFFALLSPLICIDTAPVVDWHIL